MGYVGEANAELLSKYNHVRIFDINYDVMKKYNYDKENVFDSDIFILCVPTDSVNGRLDCSVVDKCIDKILSHNRASKIIIRSTVSIGFTESMQKKYNTDRIYFVPEFLREGQNIYDTFYPSRIIAPTHEIAELFFKPALNSPEILICSNTEAEAIKLFSNTFLACRVALFNEIDTECYKLNIDSKNVIIGMCMDKRIGDYYNNPSFGFGGYCLPKDSEEIANISTGNILKSIPESNKQRKDFITDVIREKYKGMKIGINSLAMKSGSDNNKCSALSEIIDNLKDMDITVMDNIDVMICNRTGEIFTRDIFKRD